MRKIALPYSKEILKHFKNPKNLGRMKNSDAIGEAGNPMCGDVMRIYIKVKKDSKGKLRISDVKGEVFGCIVAVANTSMLTTMVKGKSFEEALKIDKEDLIKKLGGKKKIPPIKLHCSILALDALHEAIYNYYKAKGLPIPKELEERHKLIQKTLEDIEKRHKEFVKIERKILE
ncbi:MAG: iron-sulfur cluster assembly scaffold protein [Candidatus Aenigmatarchaeota archaeon]